MRFPPYRLALFLCLLFWQGFGIITTHAQESGELTAEELLVKASAYYNEGKYAEAAASYEAFIRNFGASPDAKAALANLRYPLVMCYLHLQKFDKALEAIENALKTEPPLPVEKREELEFWKGVCFMQEEDYEKARTAFQSFRRDYPASPKASEALLLSGTTYLLEDKYADAAKAFTEARSKLKGVNRGRASVLELYALLQADKLDDALSLVREEFPQMADLLQIITFQNLTLELGSRYLETKEYRKAIQCLQRVWPSDRLLKHQEKRLMMLESRLQAVEAQTKSDPYQRFMLSQMILKVKREIQNFRKMENFDSALRLRLATAFQAMRRYRESALILEEMLQEMPPDPIVEKASVNLAQCWMQIERYPKVVETADAFEKKFPKSAEMPRMLYMKAVAEQKDQHYPEAIAALDQILKNYPDSEFAPRALFMKGFTQLLAEDNKEAIKTFEEFLKKYSDHELADATLYWRVEAYSLDKQFERCRELADEYLAQRKDGAFRGAVTFRKAYAAHSLRDFQTSMRELNEFVREWPGHERHSEALLLLGDAYMNEGEMEYGIAAFKRIPPQDTRFYEEGWFKVGKALRLMERYDEIIPHFEKFRQENPRSPRVAEAIFHIGKVYRERGEEEKARDIYWEAIEEHGDDPGIRSVEDLFPALARLYRGPEEQSRYLARLRDLREDADREGKKTLAMRALWAQAMALRKTNPEAARMLLVDASSRVNVQTTNPLLMADFADALLQSGDKQAGARMYANLVKWNPRAPQKDRAFAALGMLELERGNERTALRYFERFEQETMGSMLFGRIMLAKANLLEQRGEYDAAKKSLESLLASAYVPGQEKAEALYRIGELYMKQGKPQLAFPYFQRIYVMHGRWKEWVARAYLRSGEALEALKDSEGARKTYQEMVEREELAGLEEMSEARRRLEQLGIPREAAPESTQTEGEGS